MVDKTRNRKPNLSEVIDARLQVVIDALHTTLPGKIDAFDPATQKANVKPLLKRPLVDEDGVDIESEVLPVIPDVPVRFPRADFGGAKFFMSWPLKRGDLVTLHFTERSLDRWLSQPAGDDVDPVQFRTHDLSDCFAVPGLYPHSEPLAEVDPDNLVLGQDAGGIQMHFLPDSTCELRVGGTADVSVCIAEQLQSFWDNTFKPTHYDTHVHPTGVGPSGPPAAPAPAMAAAIISSIFKLKDG